MSLPSDESVAELQPRYIERNLVLENGLKAKEVTVEKSYGGRPENYRSDRELAKLDKANRQEVRSQLQDSLPSDEMGHRHAASWGRSLGETALEAATDERNLSAQSWVINRGADSPWRDMEREVFKYREQSPQQTITVSVTERFIPDKYGDRPVSRTVSIRDQDGATPEDLVHWTSDGRVCYMNPQWQNGNKV